MEIYVKFPVMNWRKVLQFSLVHVGVAITAVPINSTLNRIMIADMNLSALLVGFFVALPYLLSPLQVFAGNWSDRNPVWGRHRSPWIVMGGLMASFGCYLTAHTVFLMQEDFVLGLVASVAAFTVWGVGVNVASVSYLSLLSEQTHEGSGWRSRAVSVMWTAMIVSTIITSLVLSRMLENFSISALYTAFGLVWLVASAFVLFGAAGIESQADSAEAGRHQATSPMAALRGLAGNGTAQRFFLYLTLVLISIHAQDVLLEPYGAEVLGMSVSATSRLTSIWGLGFFVTMVGGLPLVRRLGKKRSANIGAVVAALAFGLIVAAGLVQSTSFFMAAIFLLGLGGGLMTVSNLSFMLDMTVPQAAGLYMGAWGVANFAGQAIGNLASGLIRDVTLRLTGSEMVGYTAVFGLEIVGLIVAVFLFRTISVQSFRRDAEVQLHEVLAIAGD
jgi:MFS transporter, BCD family, chlorophyll transporter